MVISRAHRLDLDRRGVPRNGPVDPGAFRGEPSSGRHPNGTVPCATPTLAVFSPFFFVPLPSLFKKLGACALSKYLEKKYTKTCCSLCGQTFAVETTLFSLRLFRPGRASSLPTTNIHRSLAATTHYLYGIDTTSRLYLSRCSVLYSVEGRGDTILYVCTRQSQSGQAMTCLTLPNVTFTTERW